MSEKSRAPDLGSEREVEHGLGDPFTAAFRTTRMPMLITDPRQRDNPIIFVNDAFVRLTGYAREEVLGRNCRFLQGPETDREQVREIREALADGRGVEMEILNYRKDGTPFWNALFISPVQDEAGRLLYFFASQFDITAKRQAQIDLERAKDELETQVRRRTRDLQAALDQKTALLHEVDHRVKNNLQVVSSLVLLQARRTQDPGAQRVLSGVAERVSALATVHRLLYPVGDVSRFDLADLASNLCAELLAVDADRIACRLEVDHVAVPAAKAASLALLLNELVTNAVKHAFPDGRKGRITVRAARRRGELDLVVEDDGIGLLPPPDERGFGRTLVEMLGRQLKAKVAWDGAPPGTRVTVTLPLNAEEAPL